LGKSESGGMALSNSEGDVIERNPHIVERIADDKDLLLRKPAEYSSADNFVTSHAPCLQTKLYAWGKSSATTDALNLCG
jgi:hypothetical protein